MRRDVFLSSWGTYGQEMADELPGIPFQTALELLRACHTHRDDELAYQKVTGVIAALAAEGEPMKPLESLLQIFPRDSKNQKTLHIRLQGLLKQHEEQQALNRHWHAPAQ